MLKFLNSFLYQVEYFKSSHSKLLKWGSQVTDNLLWWNAMTFSGKQVTMDHKNINSISQAKNEWMKIQRDMPTLLCIIFQRFLLLLCISLPAVQTCFLFSSCVRLICHVISLSFSKCFQWRFMQEVLSFMVPTSEDQTWLDEICRGHALGISSLLHVKLRCCWHWVTEAHTQVVINTWCQMN